MRTTATILLSFASVAFGFDAWDVLKADLTCCPQHTTPELCTSEGGARCIWIADNPQPEIQAIYTESNKACVGMAYLRCQLAESTTCCSPECGAPIDGPGTDPIDGPGGVTDPVCFPKEPVPAPTPQPTLEKCALGTSGLYGYSFEGGACQISGDPHVTQFNGIRHDFQGQPTVKIPEDGPLRDSFYYVARCVDATPRDMPVQVMGTHFHWGSLPVSGVDYLTLELPARGRGAEMAYLYFSSGIAAYALVSDGATKNYDDTVAKGTTMYPLSVGNNIILDRYEVDYVEITPLDRVAMTLTIGRDSTSELDDASMYIYMDGQMNFIGDRKKMHYVYMTQDEKYKCFTCGLCGDFVTNYESSTENPFQLCDGSYAYVRRGWNMNNQPEAYDLFGWTYEYNYYKKCEEVDYEIRDNYNAMVYYDPCPQVLEGPVSNMCNEKLDSITPQCKALFTEEQLENLVTDCEVDACVLANTKMVEQGKDQTPAIEEAVDELLVQMTEDKCGINGFAETNDPGNLLNAKYIGCFKDQGSRQCTNDVTAHSHIENVGTENAAKCLDYCAHTIGSKYACMQYGHECFCSSDLAKVMFLGECPDPRGDNYFGGSWSNKVYELTAPLPASRKYAPGFESYATEQDKVMSVLTDVVGEDEAKTHYVAMGAGAFALVALGAAYCMRHKMSQQKYTAIPDGKI